MFREHERIFLAGSSGEPSAIVDVILGTPGADITTSFVPGVNNLADRTFGAGTRVSGFFMQPGLAAAQRAGTYRHLPLSYGAIVKWLNESPPYDTCVVHVTPDRNGVCSLGLAAEFTPLVMRRAKRIVAVVNPNMPRIPNAPELRLADCAVAIEASTPIVQYDTGTPDEAANKIAAHVASLMGDGAVLQLGLGKVPSAILAKLTSRRGLKIHSGMISDGIMGLAENGALDPAWRHTTTVVLGTAALYDWVADRTDIHVAGCEITHNPVILADIENFVAINSALEVDLFGQCNLEMASGRAVSGAGGAPDFARAGRLSKGGLSIVALPATFGGGKGSRIKPVLGGDALVSLPRTDVDFVVTEEGIADLRGRSVHERAEVLIGIAAPGLRPDLTGAWREIAARL
jgi:acyl-CoA hydrolase